MSKRAEELAKYVCVRVDKTIYGEAFNEIFSALHEYGQEVRRRDAEVCTRLVDVENMPGCYRHPDNIECAAAIDREPLP